MLQLTALFSFPVYFSLLVTWCARVKVVPLLIQDLVFIDTLLVDLSVGPNPRKVVAASDQALLGKSETYILCHAI